MNRTNRLKDQHTSKKLRPGAMVKEGGVSNDIPTFRQAMQGEDAEEWKAAIEKEMEALRHNQYWAEATPPENFRVLRTKIVLRIKHKPDRRIDKYKT